MQAEDKAAELPWNALLDFDSGIRMRAGCGFGVRIERPPGGDAALLAPPRALAPEGGA